MSGQETSGQTSDVVPLTDAEREALWTVWESGVEDDAELAGLFFATVALIRSKAVAAARADERERVVGMVAGIADDLCSCDRSPRGPHGYLCPTRLLRKRLDRLPTATKEADRG